MCSEAAADTMQQTNMNVVYPIILEAIQRIEDRRAEAVARLSRAGLRQVEAGFLPWSRIPFFFSGEVRRKPRVIRTTPIIARRRSS